MSDRVLVLGAGGFLGRHTVSALTERGINTLPVTRGGQNGSLSCDLEDDQCVKALLAGTRPDVIINCAVVADFGPDAYARQHPVNVQLPGLCANWCSQHEAHFVQVSASLVQGVCTTRIDAGTPIQPDTDYGRGKLLAEELIAESGARASIVRLGGIFGIDGPDHLGVNRTLRDARKGVRPTMTGPGTAKRNYIYVRDAAAGLLQCIDDNLLGVHWLAGSQTFSIAQMLQTVCDVFLPGTHPDQIPGEDGSDQVVVPSPAFKPTRTFRQALEDMI